MEMVDLSELINEELYEQLPTSVLEFIDSGVTLTYLANEDGVIVFDVENGDCNVDWTFFISGNSIVIRYEVLSNFKMFASEYLEESGVSSYDEAVAIADELERELFDIYEKIKRRGYRASFSHWQTGKLFGFHDIEVNVDTLDVDALLEIWRDIIDFDRRVKHFADEHSVVL